MDHTIRSVTFDWLLQQVNIRGDVLDRKLLEKGFEYNKERITLVGPQGIWKPKKFTYPLSITTTPDSPYSDRIDPTSGLLSYSYRGGNPNHHVNMGLREMMKNNIPLIYFHGILKGRYLATWPVYIIQDDEKNLTFTVAVDDIHHLLLNKEDIAEEPDANYRRNYITAEVKIRLHQRLFRERVIQAYKTKCAFCSLRHNELLDAAHIIPDNEALGEPLISNGLSLCKIHHAAYDKFILGISPDYIIKVREDILEEIDGPMLKHGIQALEGKKIILPNQKHHWPNRDKLSDRFEKFLNRVA